MTETPRLILANPAFAALAAPFVAAGVLRDTDAHVADRVARLADEEDPRVLLGLAFAIRAPRTGSVGVSLQEVRERARAEVALDDPEQARRFDALAWPAPATDWQAATLASPLVGRPEDPPRPFAAHRGLLIPRRYWRTQACLRDDLLRRARRDDLDIAGAPLDAALLRRDLDRLFPPARGLPAALDPQRLAALVALVRPFSVIAGGPGTGKTYTVKKILAALRGQWRARHGRDPSVALAAPTGKAAVRMIQAIGEGLGSLNLDGATRAWLGSQGASTIHRLIGVARALGSRERFGRDRRLPHEVVVVDEASMIDLALMGRLVEAVRDDARLILLGDPDQLASVAAGSVLADVVAGSDASEGVVRLSPSFAARLERLDPATPVAALSAPEAAPISNGIVRYRRPFRFKEGSGLGRVAAAIASNDAAARRHALDWLAGRRAAGLGPFPDLSLVAHQDGALPAALLERIIAGYLPCLTTLLDARPAADDGAADEASTRAALDRLEAFRVLAAHRRGAHGVAGLRRAIIQALTERAELAREAVARGVDDAPARALARLRIRGDWWVGRPVLVTENRDDLDLRNGDVGLVVSGTSRARARVAFPTVEAGGIHVVDAARLPAHETAFSMTIHKSQGSQYDEVVVVLPARPSALLTRELVYTALTRARARVVVVGSEEILARALSRTVDRASTLGALLWEEASPQEA
jgi:exodeoxyribonuclease V alpha subunit